MFALVSTETGIVVDILGTFDDAAKAACKHNQEIEEKGWIPDPVAIWDGFDDSDFVALRRGAEISICEEG